MCRASEILKTHIPQFLQEELTPVESLPNKIFGIEPFPNKNADIFKIREDDKKPRMGQIMPNYNDQTDELIIQRMHSINSDWRTPTCAE